ncbi:choloylglycine hydrolase [Vibrio genomosp. F10 str. ZF-129]|uniref:Choloylglycine hydrolase n=1 Tax=Vibrio genomosp. F10 str. ZF-129 TaxID=1187848 RepID=A0A1E5BGT2_9VIBR|nr:linear amide C-N hydrolase [Vibrio genomosp. F10]OEE35831.1 choloylglycine hydrolase [Vibrio genomosp. F10 str. ZF-129]
MCTRIVNSLDQKNVMTGRNFDWHYPLTTYLYRQQANGEVRVGGQFDLTSPHTSLEWKVDHASICAYLGSDQLGFAAIDGINDKGLVVNGLEDLLAHFEDATEIISTSDSLAAKVHQIRELIEKDKKAFNDDISIPDDATLLCSLRWVQFVLDRFDSVQEAAEYFRSNPDNLFIYSGNVPDGHEQVTKTKLHLALSDPTGNSSVIELRGDGFTVNESCNYNVVTVTPRFEVQQWLLEPWLEKWQSPKQFAGLTLFDVPGGTATHQRFARANYFYNFAQPQTGTDNILAQTRSLMASCATPLGVHLERQSENAVPSATTQWTSISDQRLLCYHFVNTHSLGHQWLDFKPFSSDSERVLLIGESDVEKEPKAPIYGDLNEHMKPCSAPFTAISS